MNVNPKFETPQSDEASKPRSGWRSRLSISGRSGKNKSGIDDTASINSSTALLNERSEEINSKNQRKASVPDNGSGVKASAFTGTDRDEYYNDCVKVDQARFADLMKKTEGMSPEDAKAFLDKEKAATEDEYRRKGYSVGGLGPAMRYDGKNFVVW